MFPHVKSVSVEFLFLKFDCALESEWKTGIYQGRETKKLYHNGGGLISLSFGWDEIEGFEYLLENYQKYTDLFTKEDAVKNFAAQQGEPEDGSFGGKLSCGFAKEPGQLKKDGTLMWHCPFRFATNYWYISKNNEWVKSCFVGEKDSLTKSYPEPEYKWELKSYKGCENFSKYENRSENLDRNRT